MGFVNGPLGWNINKADGRCTEGDESTLKPSAATGDLYAFAYAACCKYAERTVLNIKVAGIVRISET